MGKTRAAAVRRPAQARRDATVAVTDWGVEIQRWPRRKWLAPELLPHGLTMGRKDGAKRQCEMDCGDQSAADTSTRPKASQAQTRNNHWLSAVTSSMHTECSIGYSCHST